MAAPRAVVKLADLLRMGGIRPLNLTVKQGDHVKIVLSAPAGAWAKGVPEMAISLSIK
jgi:Ca-activated chloride channel family protein